ncbi:MAG: hypothetical protein A3F73_05505 [Gallionellales bacterium RIFCSPLOWO2_12_FULL_59_22]|nr:MAG: hypothetical protein A3H99_05575 [Gallionellales bacterium RIFCSPLOWO2_02_FULL_59_110]OGT02408.1 MAG: hypothetical protein A2Z65_12855 [Gallionellales bacterium RIFCSPLOWO2_02_58_13]OGT12055.1 MAG: hypothetical protein A3F73_05505 [Gallionellales bacterium RIFCSPLOWO2_12_FULL_59_22]
MSGTTLCPHCDTRFKIADTQLEAHQGMVRCGNCLQAFDARPGYIPDQPSPQLELPILDKAAAPATELPGGEPQTAEPVQAFDETSLTETPPDDPATLTQPTAADEPVAQPATLAERVAILQDDESGREPPPEYRRWLWAVAAFLLLLALLAQAAYFFRVDLAARLPGLKPALTGYCQLLGCSVPLPQKTGLMSIESSDLEADPARENQITLNALLRNRAPYPQAFPNLELTLNDTHDTPLARRIFKPKDYLPPLENEQTGLLPNHEISVRLHLNTNDLMPTGYRLVLFYPQQ